MTPVSTGGTRLVCSVLAFAVAGAALAPRPARAQRRSDATASAPATEARELNDRAQAQFADGDYAGAAQSYARIFEVLPENRTNREERDNTLLVALEVHREAYRQERAGGDPATVRRAAGYLCSGKALYEGYLASYRGVYGSGAEPSLDARESFDELDRMLGEVESELGSAPCEEPPPPTEQAPPPPAAVPGLPPPPAAEPPRGPSGMGLIVAGGITLVAALGASSMIIIGGLQSRDSDSEGDMSGDDIVDEVDDIIDDAMGDEADSGDDDGPNALLIAGSVVTGVLLASGSIMLGIGTKRRMRYLAVAPYFNGQLVGLGLQGRF